MYRIRILVIPALQCYRAGAGSRATRSRFTDGLAPAPASDSKRFQTKFLQNQKIVMKTPSTTEKRETRLLAAEEQKWVCRTANFHCKPFCKKLNSQTYSTAFVASKTVTLLKAVVGKCKDD